MEYIPAPGSPTYELMKKKERKQESDSDEDPLDAFMAGIDAEVKKNTYEAELAEEERKEDKSKGIRTDIDGEDNEESYYRYPLLCMVKLTIFHYLKTSITIFFYSRSLCFCNQLH